MSDWTSGSFSTVQNRASGMLGDVRSSGSATPDWDPGVAYRATRHVASMSKDAEECARMLSMLGLDAAMGKQATEEAA